MKNGYILQVAPVTAFDSYTEFQDTIRSLPIEFSLEPTPSVQFTGLDGVALTARYGSTPTVAGKPVDYSKWKLFDGPFTQADRKSQTLEMIYGQQRYFLDFKNGSAKTSIVTEP